jgi:hypothetical protein
MGMSDASLPHCDCCGHVEYSCTCEPMGEGYVNYTDTSGRRCLRSPDGKHWQHRGGSVMHGGNMLHYDADGNPTSVSKLLPDEPDTEPG